MIEQLHDALQKPLLLLITEKLWSAYYRLQHSRIHSSPQASEIKGQNQKRQLCDIIALVKFAIGLEQALKPFAEQVDNQFKRWIFRHNAQRTTSFTPEQTEWLRMIKDHIATSAGISRDDFDYSPFANKGGLQKAWGLLENELGTMINELNRELVA